MDPLEALAIFAAGIAAGAINAVVGSGTLITFPVLIALGYQPLIANVSNNIGLVPGRDRRRLRLPARARGPAQPRDPARDLLGRRRRSSARPCCSSFPPSAFDAIVPVLIAIALVLVVAQPRIERALAHRPEPKGEHGLALRGAITASGVYGGYFGAGQGILLMGILGIAHRDTLQRLNGLKNVLAGLVNFDRRCDLRLRRRVDWGVAGLIAAGSIIGGLLGARYGRRLEPTVLRALIVVVGLTAIVAAAPRLRPSDLGERASGTCSRSDRNRRRDGAAAATLDDLAIDQRIDRPCAISVMDHVELQRAL